jgi:hypothetical protein
LPFENAKLLGVVAAEANPAAASAPAATAAAAVCKFGNSSEGVYKMAFGFKEKERENNKMSRQD